MTGDELTEFDELTELDELVTRLDDIESAVSILPTESPDTWPTSGASRASRGSSTRCCARCGYASHCETARAMNQQPTTNTSTESTR